MSFLSERTFYVRIDVKLFSSKPVRIGVPHGSCLPFKLLSVYINDMPQYNPRKTTLFADDTLYYATQVVY